MSRIQPIVNLPHPLQCSYEHAGHVLELHCQCNCESGAAANALFALDLLAGCSDGVNHPAHGRPTRAKLQLFLKNQAYV
jgi:hypothetical protein